MHVAEPAGTTLKQRWKTQMLPFESTCTRMTSPHWPPFKVFGSVGQPYGAMVGALVIGMASELAAIWTPSLKQVVAFVILALILLVRPAGLWRKSFVQMDVAAR